MLVTTSLCDKNITNVDVVWDAESLRWREEIPWLCTHLSEVDLLALYLFIFNVAAYFPDSINIEEQKLYVQLTWLYMGQNDVNWPVELITSKSTPLLSENAVLINHFNHFNIFLLP